MFSVGVIILSIITLAILLYKLSCAICRACLADSIAIAFCVWLLFSAINLIVLTYPSRMVFSFVNIPNWVSILTFSSEVTSLFLK